VKLLARADAAVEDALVLMRALPRTQVRGRSRIEPRLSRAASLLISRRVEVRCWSRAEWPHVIREYNAYFVERRADLAGFAFRERAHIWPVSCDFLSDFPTGRSAADSDDAFALNVVAHEAKHVASPLLTEAQVECYALQHVGRVARLLGAPPSLARELPRVAWRSTYPHNDPEYGSPDCRPGGPLDETPHDGVWP
jgi:hypothetical protein